MATALLPLDQIEEDDLVGCEVSVLQESLRDFVRSCWSIVESADFVSNWHIDAICDHLQAVSTGEIPNLLINIPPGCSKSLLCCVFFPCWSWTSNPSSRWLFASYDQRLSTRDSVKCRALLSSSLYQKFWGSKFNLVKDQNQKIYFETDKGGYRLATSVGGHGTGEHPDFIVCDDPNNVQQAESELERQSVIDWWDLTMSSRGVSRNVRRVIIQQRLHDNDLSGHILRKGNYVHLCLPMRYEACRMQSTPLGWNDPRTKEGELLTPKQFSEPVVEALEKNLGVYGVSGQLQQRPAPKEGGLFKVQWFQQRVMSAPHDSRRVRSWDIASSPTGCYSCGVLLAVDKERNFYVEDVVRTQSGPEGRDQLMVATAKADDRRFGPNRSPVIVLEKQPGAAGIDLHRYLAKKLAGFPVREYKPSGDKVVRAEPWAGQLGAGNVFLVKGNWNDEFVNEHLTFPNGMYVDQVDASSQAFACLLDAVTTTPFKILSFGATRKPKEMRVCSCSFEGLVSVIVEEPSLLIVVGNPPDPPPKPQHALDSLLDFLPLAFADIAPAELAEKWLQPWRDGLLPEKIAFSREQAKELWRFIGKKRDKQFWSIVVAGPDDRRAFSIAKGISSVYSTSAGVYDLQGEACAGIVNEHVLAMVKSGRGMVLV